MLFDFLLFIWPPCLLNVVGYLAGATSNPKGLWFSRRPTLLRDSLFCKYDWYAASVFLPHLPSAPVLPRSNPSANNFFCHSTTLELIGAFCVLEPTLFLDWLMLPLCEATLSSRGLIRLAVTVNVGNTFGYNLLAVTLSVGNTVVLPWGLVCALLGICIVPIGCVDLGANGLDLTMLELFDPKFKWTFPCKPFTNLPGAEIVLSVICFNDAPFWALITPPFWCFILPPQLQAHLDDILPPSSLTVTILQPHPHFIDFSFLILAPFAAYCACCSWGCSWEYCRSSASQSSSASCPAAWLIWSISSGLSCIEVCHSSEDKFPYFSGFICLE